MTDERIGRARKGDLDAMAELLEEHGDSVRAQVRRDIPVAMRSIIDEDDVMQVTYLEAFLGVETLAAESPAGFASWLRGVAEHNLTDGLRELSRHKRQDPRRRADSPIDALLAEVTSPSRGAARSEDRARVQAALDDLPQDYALVVRLYDLEGRSIDEVAQALGRSRGAVHMLRQRAHDRLRGRLA